MLSADPTSCASRHYEIVHGVQDSRTESYRAHREDSEASRYCNHIGNHRLRVARTQNDNQSVLPTSLRSSRRCGKESELADVGNRVGGEGGRHSVRLPGGVRRPAPGAGDGVREPVVAISTSQPQLLTVPARAFGLADTRFPAKTRHRLPTSRIELPRGDLSNSGRSPRPGVGRSSIPHSSIAPFDLPQSTQFEGIGN